MTLLLLLFGHALASELPPWPQAEATTSGECAESYPITIGKPVPFLTGSDALARCSAVAEPLSSYAHLLAIEQHAITVRALYVVDTIQLRAERDHWQAEAEQATRWHRQPWFVAVTTSALVSSLLVTYSMTTGGR